jgi:hypothetical protein
MRQPDVAADRRNDSAAKRSRTISQRTGEVLAHDEKTGVLRQRSRRLVHILPGLLERRRRSLRRARRNPGSLVPLLRAQPGAAASCPSRGAQHLPTIAGRASTPDPPDGGQGD